MRRVLVAGARVIAAVAVAATALVWPAGTPSVSAAPPTECKVKPGVPDPGTASWAQTRLGFDKAWPITMGAGVTVAVIDSGVNTDQSQMAQIRYRSGSNLVGGAPRDTRDCVGHGTGVAGIIAAPKVLDVAFTGVAPQASIMPIKVTNENKNISPGVIAAGIDKAVAAPVQVINISITTNSDVGVLRAATQRAERAGIVVVAASNESENADRPAYPAAYPTVLAVGATDNQDQPAKFTGTGSYVDVAAPGDGVEMPAPISGYTQGVGTSFATPYVSGTAALVLAAHPGLTPAQVRARLEATADPPPGATVPSKQYGYGIVNPLLAVTAVRDDSAASEPPGKQRAIPPAPPSNGPDRHLQHLALAVGTILLGLAVLAGLTAAVIRRGSWFGHGAATPRT